MTLPPQNTPQHKGLDSTVDLINHAIYLLYNITKDNQTITAPNDPNNANQVAERVAAYNNLVALRKDASYQALNSASPKVAAFFTSFLGDLDAYLKTVPLTVGSPSTQTGEQIPLEQKDTPGGTSNGASWHNVTLYDLIIALTDISNGKTPNIFGVGQGGDSFEIDGNDGVRSPLPNWMSQSPMSNVDTNSGIAKGNIGTNMHKCSGCHENYDFSASGTASDWEGYAQAGAPTDGGAAKNALENFLENGA